MIELVLIDDEHSAIKSLEWEIESFCKNVHIVATFTSAADAVSFLTRNTVDCVFLDIEMPDMDGFQFLELFPKRNFAVVITTAFDQYAIKAIKESALDYLLKPINPKRFAQAIEKVNTNLIESAEKNEKKLALDNQIFIRDGEKCWLVKISDIYLFEVDGNYTKVFFQNEKAIINKSLNQIEEKLPEKYFFRANRNQIVNVQYIGKI